MTAVCRKTVIVAHRSEGPLRARSTRLVQIAGQADARHTHGLDKLTHVLINFFPMPTSNAISRPGTPTMASLGLAIVKFHILYAGTFNREIEDPALSP